MHLQQVVTAQPAQNRQHAGCRNTNDLAVERACVADDGSWLQGVPALGKPCHSSAHAQLYGPPSTLLRLESRESTASWLRTLLLAVSQVPGQQQQYLGRQQQHQGPQAA